MINYQFRKILLKYIPLLLMGFIVEWWIVFYSPFNLPERFPYTPIRISGFLLIVLCIIIFIKAEKEYSKIKPDASLLELTGVGTIICFFSQVIFQLIRQPFLKAITLSEHLYYFSIGVAVMTIFSSFMSFFVAFQLKTRKTFQLVLLIVGFFIIIQITTHFFPSFFGPY